MSPNSVVGLVILLCFSGFSLILAQNLHLNGRIIVGVPVSIAQRPFMASLQYVIHNNVIHVCGACIISTKYLLTAATCNPGIHFNLMHARVGSTDKSYGGQLLKVGTFTPNPNFNTNTLDYNAAVVSFDLNAQIVLSANAKLIRLVNPGARDPLPGTILNLAGWGKTNISSPWMSLTLNEVGLPVVSRTSCIRAYPLLTSNQMCIGGTSLGGTGACSGDVGGPAILGETVYGIFSGTLNCSAPRVPQIFTRVTDLRGWLSPYADAY